MPRHTRRNPSTNLPGNGLYGRLDDPEQPLRASRANRRARARRNNVQALLSTRYDPTRRAIFSHLNLSDLSNVRATSRFLNQQNPSANPWQPQLCLVPITCSGFEIVPRQQAQILNFPLPPVHTGGPVPDWHQACWPYTWSQTNLPYGTIFDPDMQRPNPMQPCPHTNLNNANAIFLKCEGTRLGIATHGASYLVCSLCAERNWVDMSWVFYYPYRIVPYCYDCSRLLHPTNASNPDDVPANFCTCTEGGAMPDWNNQQAARVEWFCDACALLYGTVKRATIDANVRLNIPPNGNPPPYDWNIESHVNPMVRNRNLCVCGRNFRAIIGSYPIPSWIPTPAGVAFQSMTMGRLIFGWQNTNMYRQCMACLGHVPQAMITRRMFDGLDFEPA
jgi:hypothetical protein